MAKIGLWHAERALGAENPDPRRSECSLSPNHAQVPFVSKRLLRPRPANHGPRPTAKGQRITYHGQRITYHGPWPDHWASWERITSVSWAAHGPRITASWERRPDHGPRPAAHGQRPTASGPRLTASWERAGISSPWHLSGYGPPAGRD